MESTRLLSDQAQQKSNGGVFLAVLPVLTLAAVFVMAFIVQGVTDVKILRILLSMVIGVMGLAILSCIYMIFVEFKHQGWLWIVINLVVRIPLYSVVLVSAIMALIEANQISNLKSSTRQLFSVAKIISYIILAPLIVLTFMLSTIFVVGPDAVGTLAKGSMYFWVWVLPIHSSSLPTSD